jgi:NAD(P)H-dependent flavin oxidoreductase YrpB (nitropropane dioxygenase family)
MSVRVSTSSLAAAVAECGGIGTIGGSGIPVDQLQEDIRKAKRMTGGVIAVNIMFAIKQFTEAVKASIEAGVDMIVTGAGFSRDIFKVGKEYDVPIVSIVSSPEFGKLAEKSRAAAVVVEAKEAGGHLARTGAAGAVPRSAQGGQEDPADRGGRHHRRLEIAEMPENSARTPSRWRPDSS